MFIDYWKNGQVKEREGQGVWRNCDAQTANDWKQDKTSRFEQTGECKKRSSEKR